MEAQRDFLGKGFAFPLRTDARGRLATASYEQRVEDSVYMILATARGERVALPDFGCGIHNLVFGGNDAATIGSVLTETRRALTRWEQRIDVLDVQVFNPPDAQNVLLIRVDYRIRANNAAGNVVYPFYITEGR